MEDRKPPTMLIYRPRYISLDTSHIAQWIRDTISARAEDQQAAAEFDRWLAESGCIPLITLHHIEELCSHNDTGLVHTRLRFLGARKLVAWIGDSTVDIGPSGIVSILREELRAAYEAPLSSPADIRQEATRHLFRVGSGQDMLGPDPDIWLHLSEIFAARTAYAREMVAITRSDVIDIRDMPIHHFINGRRREGEGLRRRLSLIRGTYATDIEKHGDRRIKDPDAVASEFLQPVEEMTEALPHSPKELILSVLAQQGIEPDDIRQNSTVGEILDLGEFLQRVRIVAPGMQLPWREVKRRVRMERIPSELITAGMRRHAQKLPERKGSDLNDTYLACLAAYADVTFVDKRTRETFRRARSKDAAFDAICKRVEVAPSYRNIPKIISREEPL